MPRLRFLPERTDNLPEGPNFSGLNWDNIKYRPQKTLKAVTKTYNKTPYSFTKDYIKQSHDELCDRSDFKLSAQQKFVSDFLRPENPTRGLLVYHGLGSGKTLTSIIVGEAFKPFHTNGGALPGRSRTRVIIVVPVALINSYKKEILGKGPGQVLIPDSGGKLHRQNYNAEKRGPTRAKLLEKNIKKKKDDIAKLEKEGKRGEKRHVDLVAQLKKDQKELDRQIKVTEEQLNKSYEIISHQRFLNLLIKKNKQDGTYGLGEMYDREGKNPMRMKRTLVIIDEIQRLISETGSSYQKLLYSLKYHSNPKLKLVLLTGTPIYDKPFEAALTINLLRPRIPFPTTKTKFEEMFVKFKKKGNLLPKPVGTRNEALFKYLCSGYVSYYSGGNPKAFPFKTIVNTLHRMHPKQQGAYLDILESELRKAVKEKQRNKRDLVPDAALDLLHAGGGEEDDKEDSMNVFMLTQMYANIALPGVDDKMAKYLEYKYNLQNMDPEKVRAMSRNWDKKAIIQEGLAELRSRVENDYRTVGLRETLKKLRVYSEKYSKIASLIISGEGPAFFFSNFLDYGVKAMAQILLGIGFEEYKPGKKTTDPNKLKFVIWSSDTAGGKGGEGFARDIQQLFNSDENKNGEKIKVILGTRSIMEGISFANVRQVHISDPWWNESRIEQIAARAIRNCSHKGLPPEKRSVMIFKHMSTYTKGNDDVSRVVNLLKELNAGGELLRSFEKQTIEEYMYERANQKMGLTLSFQKLLKESAVDCSINKYGNLDRLVEQYQPEDMEIDSSGMRKVGYRLTYLDRTTDTTYMRKDVGLEPMSFREVVENSRGYVSQEGGKRFVFIEIKRRREKLVETTNRLQNVKDGLVVKENVLCNNSKNNLFKEKRDNGEITKSLYDLYRNDKMTGEISKLIVRGQFKRRLLSFINSQSKNAKVLDERGEPIYKGSMSKLRNKVKKILMKKAYKSPHEKMVQDLIYKYGLYGEGDEDILLTMSDEFLRNKIRGAEKSESASN